jgi:hypothetical protein
MNEDKRIGYVEWMMKIKSNYQYHTHIAKGIDQLVNSEPVKVPPGVKKKPATAWDKKNTIDI